MGTRGAAALMLLLTAACTTGSPSFKPPPTAATPSALAPAPRYQAEPARHQGGVATIGDWQFPASLPPTYLPGPAGAELVEQTLFSGLLGVDPNLGFYGDLARSVPTPKLVGTGMDVAYELRPGLHWSDGQPINADDVVFTSQVTPRTEGYDQIAGIEKTADLALTVHFKTVYPAFGLLFPAILPRHRLAGIARARLDNDAYWSAPNVVSGAFQVAESVPADHLTLQRNPHYADGRADQPLLNHSAYLEKLVFKAFATKGALLAALKAGDVQAAVELDEGDQVSGARLQSVPALSYEQVTFNQQSGLWKDDPRLSAALADAVDVDGMLAGPLQKRVPAAVGPISPQLDWAFDGELTPPHFQPDAARAALDADGWIAGPGGVRTKAGRPLQFSLASVAGSPLREAEAETLAAGWRQAGAEVRLEFFSPDELFGSVLARGGFDTALFAWDSPPDPDGLFATLHSSRVPPAGANYSRCSNPALDADLAAGRATLDRARRGVAYRDLQVQYRKLACEVPLYQRLNIGLSSRHLHNYAPNPAGPGNTWNVADWWIDG